MDIRPVHEQDLGRCAQLYSEIFTAQPHREGWTYGSALEHLREIWARCGGTCFVAEQQDRVVGYAFCSVHTWWTGKVMRIEEQGVDFRLQRHGIGRMLLEHCVETGRNAYGIEAVEVVTPRTVQAVEFYSSQGFQSAGRELLSRAL